MGVEDFREALGQELLFDKEACTCPGVHFLLLRWEYGGTCDAVNPSATPFIGHKISRIFVHGYQMPG